MTNQPFEIIRHSTDSEGLPIVDVRGTYLSNPDATKLRDELNRLLPGASRRRREAVKLVFELSMPGRASWNGRWSGEDSLYAIVENFTTLKRQAKASKILEGQPYFYRWDDGWCARISVRSVENKEAASIKKRSKGFCGYEWMIVSIIDHGAIYASHDEIPA